MNICVPYLATVPTNGDCLPPSVYLSLRFPADAFDKDNDLDGDGSRSPINPDDILAQKKKLFPWIMISCIPYPFMIFCNNWHWHILPKMTKGLNFITLY